LAKKLYLHVHHLVLFINLLIEVSLAQEAILCLVRTIVRTKASCDLHRTRGVQVYTDTLSYDTTRSRVQQTVEHRLSGRSERQSHFASKA
jgi:hypothetical protein